MKSGPWRFLMWLVLPQPAKMALLPRLAGLPGFRHVTGVLAIQTRRRDAAPA